MYLLGLIYNKIMGNIKRDILTVEKELYKKNIPWYLDISMNVKQVQVVKNGKILFTLGRGKRIFAAPDPDDLIDNGKKVNIKLNGSWLD